MDKQNQKFTGFFGRFSCLSNFYPSTFTSECKEYLSNEQYYQAQKAIEANAFDTLVSIMFSSDPAEIKHLGGQINMDEDHECSWFAKKDDVMRSIIAAKFDQNKDFGI